ncbi:hypothetical protein DFH06DRAFT_1330873 [Mycena polygramma]|nr:hypothetical protein DFH06DRAFT_1330873 [Mycena polygramma]
MLPGPSSISEADKIVLFLGQYSSQWKTLELYSEEPIISFPANLRGPFTALRAFSVHSESTPLPVLLNATAVREVKIQDFSLSSWQTSLPWDQLTMVEFGYCTHSDCLEMLRHTRNIEILRIHQLTPRVPVLTIPSVCTLPRLHTVDFGPYFRDSDILWHLALPALNHLHLHSFSSECVEQFKSLVTRSGRSPRLLDLHVGDEFGRELDVGYLDVFPSVRALRVVCPSGANTRLHGKFNEFRKLFETIAQTPSILPALESIHIDHWDAEIPLSPLVQMLAARTADAQAETKLQSFTLTFEHDCDNWADLDLVERDHEVENALASLRELRSHGLEVDIRSSFKWLSGNVNSGMIERVNEVKSQ